MKFRFVPAETKHRFLAKKNVLTKLRRAAWISVAWIAAIKRDDQTESILKHQKVCCRHFITGKLAVLEDKKHPDWVPSQHMGHVSQKVKKRAADVDRKNRRDKRTNLTDTEVLYMYELPQQFQDDQIQFMETVVSMMLKYSCFSFETKHLVNITLQLLLFLNI